MSRDSEKLVPFDRGRRPPDPARVAEFAATARKLQQEREGAAALVSRLVERDAVCGVAGVSGAGGVAE